MDGYRKLEAWQQCRTLANAIYAATRSFPRDERFGLTLQLRRAGISAVANIAEGHARVGKSEFARFLNIALGSLAEIDALMQLSADQAYLAETGYKELKALRDSASRLTFMLKRNIRR